MSKQKKTGKILALVVLAALVIAGVVFLIGRVFIPSARRSSAYTIYGEVLRSAHVGDTITFGTYEQDGDRENGAEPIEWTVLAENDGKLLLISKDCLDSQPFHNSYLGVVWGKCSLRTWLNTTFAKTAFTNAERSILVSSVLDNSYPLVFEKDGEVTDQGIYKGTITEDKVFLLSADEVETYLSGELLTSSATAFAKEQGAYENNSHGNYTWWWLRTTGTFGNYINEDGSIINMENTAMTVSSDGTVDVQGDAVSRESGAVRPAILVALPKE